MANKQITITEPTATSVGVSISFVRTTRGIVATWAYTDPVTGIVLHARWDEDEYAAAPSAFRADVEQTFTRLATPGWNKAT